MGLEFSFAFDDSLYYLYSIIFIKKMGRKELLKLA